VIDAPHAAVIREDGIPELCEAKVIATDAWNDVALLSVETERAFASTTIKPLVSSVGDSLRVVGRVPWSVQDH
jgi:S1-C subfamily serine protease